MSWTINKLFDLIQKKDYFIISKNNSEEDKMKNKHWYQLIHI